MTSSLLDQLTVPDAYRFTFGSGPMSVGWQLTDEELTELMRKAVLTGKPITAEVLDEFTGQLPYPEGVHI